MRHSIRCHLVATTNHSHTDTRTNWSLEGRRILTRINQIDAIINNHAAWSMDRECARSIGSPIVRE